MIRTRSGDDAAQLNQPNSPPGAVVLGGDYQGLGIVRSLGRFGVPVCVIDDEWSIARYSRYTTYSCRVPNLRDEEQMVHALMDAGHRLGLRDWVIYPTRDEMVAALSRHHALLSTLFRVPTPGWDSIQWIWDKRNTYRLARKLGIRTPGTWYCSDVKDLEKISAELPLIIKPAIKEHFFYATGAKAWRADSRAELKQYFHRAATQVGPGEAMIQELIPGGGEQQFAYCAFFTRGEAVASMVVQRTRQHPPEFGRASTCVQTVDLPVLEELAERFLRAINYYGLVEVEFKLDPRDGQYKLLDINGRTWGYHSLGYHAGVDFPYLLYSDQIGKPCDKSRGRIGVRWIRLLTDVPTATLEILAGKRDLIDYVRSLRGVNTEAVFSYEDPLPGLSEIALIPYLIAKRGFRIWDFSISRLGNVRRYFQKQAIRSDGDKGTPDSSGRRAGWQNPVSSACVITKTKQRDAR